LAGVGGVQRGAALEKQPVSRIERLGGEMGDTIFVDITPQVGPRRASAAESKNSGQSHDDFAGGARIARGHGHRWNEANWIGSRGGAKFLPSTRPDRRRCGRLLAPARAAAALKAQPTLELVLQ